MKKTMITKFIANPKNEEINDMINDGFELINIEHNVDLDLYLFRFDKVEEEKEDDDELKIENNNSEEEIKGCEDCPSLSKKMLINPEAEDINRLYQLNYTTEKITTSPNGDVICVLSRCDSDNEENLGIKEVKISYFDGSVDIINHIDGADIDIDEGMLMAFGEYHVFANEEE